MNHKVSYPISETKNNKVNFDKLKIELSLSTAPFVNVVGFSGEILVSLDSALTDAQADNVLAIISNHDGETATAFDDNLVKQRENVILRMNQMGIYHPLIESDTLVLYLTKIDNALNGWRRSSNPIAVLGALYADAGVSDIQGTAAVKEDGVTAVDVGELEFYNFLHTVSNPTTGSKVFQFIASQIIAASDS